MSEALVLSDESPKSGVVVSGALHAALLAAVLIGFTGAPKFDDAAESIPVETVTQSQFNEIMKGERDAKPAKPVETPTKPAAQQVDNNDPPPPPTKTDEVKEEKAPAPTPPERPTPMTREAAAEATPAPRDAEIDRPQTRTDLPPTQTPTPPVKPKPVEKPKLDQLAKLVDETKPDDTPKPAPKPKTETPVENRHVFDPNSIAKLIGQGKPRSLDQTASISPLGSPTQNAQRMSPSMAAAIDGWLQDAYLRCWQQPPTMPDGAKYVAEIKIAFNVDGSLSGRPVLINPPSDPAWRAYAESAMRAVLRCNPLQVPPQYAPYFEQWKSKTVHFDPESNLG